MAEQKTGIIARITSAVSSILSAILPAKGVDANAANLAEKVGEFSSQASEKFSDLKESAQEFTQGKVDGKLADRAKDIGSQLKEMAGAVNFGEAKETFGQMGKANKAASLGGAGLAVEGATSTARNLKNKQFGKAVFSAARTAMGAVMTVAAFKAQSNGQNIGQFAQSVLSSRGNSAGQERG